MDAANVYFHFALGMLLGAVLGSKPLLERWYHRQPLATSFGRWLFFTYCGGGFAIVPSLCRMAHLPEAFCRGWWMNVFVLHPLVDRFMSGRGLLIGEFLIVGIFSAQYALIVLALMFIKRRDRRGRQ